MTRNLSASVIEKFYGYKMMRQQLSHQEKIDLITYHYEPSDDEKTQVSCFFMDQIYLAYISYIARFDKGKKHIVNCAVRQCNYSQSFFCKE